MSYATFQELLLFLKQTNKQTISAFRTYILRTFVLRCTRVLNWYKSKQSAYRASSIRRVHRLLVAKWSWFCLRIIFRTLGFQKYILKNRVIMPNSPYYSDWHYYYWHASVCTGSIVYCGPVNCVLILSVFHTLLQKPQLWYTWMWLLASYFLG